MKIILLILLSPILLPAYILFIIYSRIKTPSGDKFVDGVYYYESIKGMTSSLFIVENEGEFIHINMDNGKKDSLYYISNGKYRDTNRLLFSFVKREDGSYIGGVMGQNMGIASLVKE